MIDLSADFRIRDEKIYREFYGEKHPAPQLLKKSVYGMPELYREQICKAKLVASPGCYPTTHNIDIRTQECFYKGAIVIKGCKVR